MNSISADLDRELWSVAESGDASLVANFEAKHPSLVAELAKRSAMVAGLRGSRYASATDSGVPGFVLRPTASPISTYLLSAAGGVLLVGLATVSFLATRRVISEPTAADAVPTIDLSAQQLPDKTVYSVPSTESTVPQAYTPKSYTPAPSSTRTEAAILDDSVMPFGQDRGSMRVKIDQAHLLSAIQAIAAQSRMRLQIAPGFANPIIDVDISARDGLDALRQLGNEHGFTPFEQGNGVVLVVPAIDGEDRDLDSPEAVLPSDS